MLNLELSFLGVLYFIALVAVGATVVIGLWIACTNNEVQYRYLKKQVLRERSVEWRDPPAKGDFAVRDFTASAAVDESRTGGHDESPLRVMTWNIERGFQFEKVVAYLQKIKPDILLLQEIDVGTRRIGGIDVGAEIASRLKMHICFTTQQVVNGGVHGDAVLSRFPFEECWVTVMPRVGRGSPMDNSKVHVVPACRVASPGASIDVYSVHTDAHTGIRGRVKQINAIFSDYEKRNGGKSPAVIAGDLNTMADGYKRFLPCFCNDDLRWGSLGLSEQQWWRDNIWNHTTFKDESTQPTLKLMGGLLMSDKLDWLCVSQLEYVYRSNSKLAPSDKSSLPEAIYVSGRDASDHCFVVSDFRIIRDK